MPRAKASNANTNRKLYLLRIGEKWEFQEMKSVHASQDGQAFFKRFHLVEGKDKDV